MKRFFTEFLVILIFSMVQILKLFSDDGYVNVHGGSAKIMAEHNSIKMISEYVTIDITNADYYTVIAQFVFYNHGVDTETAVGFPQEGWGDISSVSDFKSFKTFVKGIEMKTTILPDSTLDEQGRVLKKWIIKTVKFPSKTTTNTSVIYKAPYGGISDGSAFVTYLYGTGGSWYGNISQAIFKLKFLDGEWLNIHDHTRPFQTQKSIAESEMVFKRKKNEMIWELKEIEPYISDMFSICIGGNWIPWKGLDADSFNWDKNEITIADVELLSMWQLRTFRNEFYARHGRVFNDKKLKQYFESKSWYKPNPNFSEKMLNPIELRNIQKIKEFEEKLGKEK